MTKLMRILSLRNYYFSIYNYLSFSVIFGSISLRLKKLLEVGTIEKLS